MHACLSHFTLESQQNSCSNSDIDIDQVTQVTGQGTRCRDQTPELDTTVDSYQSPVDNVEAILLNSRALI